MTELTFFKWSPAKWAMGRINLRSDNEIVAFIRIVNKYWINKCVLTLKDAILQSNKSAVQSLIENEIILVEDDHIRIKFLDEQYAEILEKSNKQSLKGKISAEKRAINKIQPNPTSVQPDSTSVEQRLDLVQPDSTDKIRQDKIRQDKIRQEGGVGDLSFFLNPVLENPPSDKQPAVPKAKRSKLPGAAAGEKINYDFIPEDSKIKEPFIAWMEYRKEINKPYKSQKSVEACYSHLLALSANYLSAAEQIVQNSIANQWQGLFALKNGSVEKTAPSTIVVEMPAIPYDAVRVHPMPSAIPDGSGGKMYLDWHNLWTPMDTRYRGKYPSVMGCKMYELTDIALDTYCKFTGLTKDVFER